MYQVSPALTGRDQSEGAPSSSMADRWHWRITLDTWGRVYRSNTRGRNVTAHERRPASQGRSGAFHGCGAVTRGPTVAAHGRRRRKWESSGPLSPIFTVNFGRLPG